MRAKPKALLMLGMVAVAVVLFVLLKATVIEEPPVAPARRRKLFGRPTSASLFVTPSERRIQLMKYTPQFVPRTLNPEDVAGIRPRNAAATCELMLLGNENCFMAGGNETMDGCIGRVGPLALTKALQPQCSKSKFWITKVLEISNIKNGTSSIASPEAVKAVPVRDYAPLRDRIIRATIPQPRRYVPPSQRSLAKFGGPLKCWFGKVYPFGFLMPQMNIIPKVSRNKIFDWSPVTAATWLNAPVQPFPQRPLTYTDEYLMSLLYEHSYFAWTHQRGGFDCLRHLEIMARGAVPLFPDYHLCERGECLRGYPLDLFQEAWELPGLEHLQANYSLTSAGRLEGKAFSNDFMFRLADVTEKMPAESRVNFRGPARINWAKFDVDRYYDLADRFLNFTQHHLTGAAGVAYILRTIGVENPRSILYVDPGQYDYVGTMVECGFGELGLNVTYLDSTEGEALWRKNASFTNTTGEEWVDGLKQLRRLQGDGFMLGRRCEQPTQTIDEATAGRAILRGEFDVIVFAQCGDGPPKGLLNRKQMGCFGRRVRLLDEINERIGTSTKVVMLGIADDATRPASYADYVLRGMYAFEREPFALVHPNKRWKACKV